MDPRRKSASAYRVADLQLRNVSRHPEFVEQMDALLASFQVESHGHDGWTVDFRFGRTDSGSLPSNAQRIWSGSVPPGVPAANYVARGFRRLELTDRGYIDLDLVAERAVIAVDSPQQIHASRYFLISLLCLALARRQHVPLHAACLAVPTSHGPRGVIIVAPSGTGKSTTSLALTSSGWKLMGDDLTLVSRSDQQLTTWGFPRVCHIRQPTLNLLPWLRELPLRPTGLTATYELSVEDLGERSFGHPQAIEPALLLVLEPHNSQGHCCQRMDAVSAMAQVCHENVQPVEGVEDPDAATSFSVIAELVRTTPAYRLSVGPQLETLGDYLGRATGVAAS